ncbi:hypothetical protein [Mesorhizobium silamurunense]|uniref:hypothetical protein n=1 Tax=Mesorhizobium silamurunense TaxID=499528 RepID=UPI00177B64A5|nr:hypothetical protein [Mesorhizobium silamurunense]
MTAKGVSEIEKLRPELLDMSVAELERRRAEIDMAITKKAEIEAAAIRAKDVKEADERITRLFEDLRWLYDKNFLSPKLLEAFTSADGQFAPHRSLKRPRA